MKRLLLLAILFSATAATALGQGTVFGIKGGLTIGIQNWQGIDQQPAFLPHGVLTIEDVPENDAFSLFASVGYQPKGSAIRNRIFNNPLNNQLGQLPTQTFIFHNASLILGAKQKFEVGRTDAKFFYSLGIRGDYTIATNLRKFNDPDLNTPLFITLPVDDPTYIRKINYGVSVGAGTEYSLGEFVGMSLEFTLHPDFSFQYEQPEIGNVTDPFTNQQISIPERRIRNVTFEVSLGFRFLRKVIYVD